MIQVRASFPDQKLTTGHSVKALSFEINQPCFVAIVGHNGAGKTTLLKTFAGLLPYKGEIFFSSPPAYLPQHMPQPWGLNAVELVAMGNYSEGNWLKEESMQKARELLTFWHLEYCMHQEAATLSGGERQLIWLAQLEMQNSDIILLDEPTQYLDVYYQAKVFAWMTSMVEKGKIIFCVTHQLDYVSKMKGYFLHVSQETTSLENLTGKRVEEVREEMQKKRPN